MRFETDGKKMVRTFSFRIFWLGILDYLSGCPEKWKFSIWANQNSLTIYTPTKIFPEFFGKIMVNNHFVIFHVNSSLEEHCNEVIPLIKLCHHHYQRE